MDDMPVVRLHNVTSRGELGRVTGSHLGVFTWTHLAPLSGSPPTRLYYVGKHQLDHGEFPNPTLVFHARRETWAHLPFRLSTPPERDS